MNKFLSACLFLAVLSGRKGTTEARVPLEEFFPYGQAVGDSKVPTADDNFVQHVLTPGYKVYFFEQGYDRLFVNNNGGVSFVKGVSQYTPTCGPQSTPMIVPFWADVDTRNGGSVWYRESSDAEVLAKATREIRSGFPDLPPSFSVRRAFIVTWDEVAFYGSAGCGADAKAKRNNFQSVVSIGNDGRQSFIIFNYEKVQWITGTASGGNCNGRGGTPAKAGFDTGDTVNFYSLPGTCTEQVDLIVNKTNVNKSGRWIFRIDEEEIEEPTQDPEPIETTTEEEIETTTEDPRECDPHDCSLRGYCFQYAQCDPETYRYKFHNCSDDLYWNPHNNSAIEYFNHNGDSEHHYHHQRESGQCHGSCDVWENLSPEVQQRYLQDEECFPTCTYATTGDCNNRYFFHPHDTDARNFEDLYCPIDTRYGRNIPLVWDQERQTCDFCYNSFRTVEGNGVREQCCEHYEGPPTNADDNEAQAEKEAKASKDKYFAKKAEANRVKNDLVVDHLKSSNTPKKDAKIFQGKI